MRFLKHIAALLVIISLVLYNSTYGIQVTKAAEENSAIQAIEKEVSLLTSLNIIQANEDEGFDPTEIVTRGEFASMLARLIGLEGISFTGESKFTDIDSSASTWSEINLLVQMGIIKGISEDTFGVEYPITYQQAIKMIVCALGYEMYAEKMGGYPFGYVSVAAQKKILKGINVAYDQEAQKGVIIKMMYNALFVDLMRPTGFGNNIQYTIESGRTLMTDNLKVYEITGKVVAAGKSKLIENSSVQEDEIEINGQIFKIGSTNAKDFLGYNVDCYYKIDEQTDKKIIVAIFHDDKTNELVLKADDIVNYSNGTYFYTQEDKSNIYEAKIETKADIIYNGKAIAYNENYMRPTSGKVVLVDTDGNGSYDGVFITQYRNIVVNSIDYYDGTISSKYGEPPIQLDMKDENKSIRIKDKDGYICEIDDIYEGDVISVIESLDKEYYDVTVIRDTVRGTVHEIEEINDKTTIRIDDTEYVLAPSYPNRNEYKIKIGDTGIFALDVDGKIADFTRDENAAMKYGFLIKVHTANDVSNTVQFKIFAADGAKMITPKAAKKVELDGDSVETSDDRLKNLVDPTVGMLIRYELNKDGEVIKIDTPTKGRYEDEDSLFKAYTLTSARYIGSTKAFAQSVVIDSKTVVFLIPTDRSKDEMYRIKNFTYFITDKFYSVESYNSTPDFVTAEALIQYTDIGDGEEIRSSSLMAVIDKITYTIDSDGNRVEKVYLGQNASSKTLLSVDDQLLSVTNNLGPGDVIRYSTNYRGQIDHVVQVYDYNEETKDGLINGSPTGTNGVGIDDGFRVFCGYVYYKKDGIIKVTTQNLRESDEGITLENTESYVVGQFKVSLYDSSKTNQKVSAGSYDDIKDYKHFGNECTKVVVQVGYGVPRSMILYN